MKCMCLATSLSHGFFVWLFRFGLFPNYLQGSPSTRSFGYIQLVTLHILYFTKRRIWGLKKLPCVLASKVNLFIDALMYL